MLEHCELILVENMHGCERKIIFQSRKFFITASKIILGIRGNFI